MDHSVMKSNCADRDQLASRNIIQSIIRERGQVRGWEAGDVRATLLQYNEGELVSRKNRENRERQRPAVTRESESGRDRQTHTERETLIHRQTERGCFQRDSRDSRQRGRFDSIRFERERERYQDTSLREFVSREKYVFIRTGRQR